MDFINNLFGGTGIVMDTIIKWAVYIGVAIFIKKMWPVMKEWVITQKAIYLVHYMEEKFGGKQGTLKFETAVSMLEDFLSFIGWDVDLTKIKEYILAAVGKLHAEQGVLPPDKRAADAEALAARAEKDEQE